MGSPVSGWPRRRKKPKGEKELRILPGNATQVARMTTLKKRQSYGPDVILLEKGIVEKTYRNRARLIRLIGSVLVSWETFIYTKLEGIPGIPRFMERPDRYSILTAYMGGENLRETRKRPDTAYFEKVVSIIRQMHNRGVIHLDMRNRRNYGIDAQGNPFIMDFASSLYIPWVPLRRTLAKLDWMGFVKVKAKTAPDLLSDKEKRQYHLGNTLSSMWLPTKVFNAGKDIIRVLRCLLGGQ
jgi:hypothetical protein